MTTIVRARGLHKHFGATIALAAVDFDAAPGECIGLVGPNGGGRSTLLRLLATLVRPSSGSIEIDGFDAVRQLYDARRRVAFVGEPGVAAHGLSARDYLTFVVNARSARAATIRQTVVDQTLERAGLKPDADVDTLSSGYRQRVTLAAAFLTDARVLLLDDPFRGFDAEARLSFSVWLSEIRDGGTTIVAAFNDERDVRSVCHRAVRLESGRVASMAPQAIAV
jgi:ABC-type multidrug transport system ATPase subunit